MKEYYIAQHVVLPPGEGRLLTLLGNPLIVKSVTRGFAVVEFLVPPGSPAVPHIHDANDEAFYVLGGEMEFQINGERARLGAGGYVLAARGTAHTFSVVSQEPARFLTINSPGRYFGLVEDLAEAFPTAGPVNLEQVAEIFARWDTRFASPPSGQPAAE
jgi:quercetin dioxygenase-like cupin family protein